MKAFLALTFLAALSLAAGVDFKNLKPRNMVMPVNPKYTAQEWQEIYAAQVPSPEIYPSYKKDIEPQPDFAGKVHVPLKEQSNRITGGSTASRGQFPWQVALIIDSASFCGGSLMNERWILTAGHCAGSSYQVVLGGNRFDGSESGSLTVISRNSWVHEEYSQSTLNNDIAVIQLPTVISITNYISPIRWRSTSGEVDDLAGSRVRVSGWGRTSDSWPSVSLTLNYVDLTVITNTQCANIYGSIITASKICCATSNGQSTCNGDSGGPLVYLESDGLYTQVGIVSFGSSAGCQQGYPVAFTRVSSFVMWIAAHTTL